jgi:hypothetical protein
MNQKGRQQGAELHAKCQKRLAVLDAGAVTHAMQAGLALQGKLCSGWQANKLNDAQKCNVLSR